MVICNCSIIRLKAKTKRKVETRSYEPHGVTFTVGMPTTISPGQCGEQRLKQVFTANTFLGQYITRNAYCDGYTRWLVQACTHLAFRLFSTCLNFFSVDRIGKRISFQDISSSLAHNVAQWPCLHALELSVFEGFSTGRFFWTKM